ncbi:MAG: gephyrin-like molybdotransferase Glp [Anaerolineales bacterium]
MSVRTAQARIRGLFRSVQSETVELGLCSGRTLAADVKASDIPIFDNSSVDGFAVIASDVARGRGAPPLHVVADIPAGTSWTKWLRPGQAARIMTGARIPKGADTVVMLEDTDVGAGDASMPAPDWVKIRKGVKPGENIRRRGMDLQKGALVMKRGHRLRPQDLGMLAMLNYRQVRVYRKPRVALLSTGNELVAVGRHLKPGQIRDTNSHTLAALLRQASCDVVSLGVARDREGAIAALLDRAVEKRADLILSSAGVSVGALDLVRNVIQARGRIEFWKANVRPGKPLAVGEYRGVPFIGLPGNPVSAFVGFELFVRPALAAMVGQAALERRVVRVTLDEPVQGDARESYLRAVVREGADGLRARLTGHQGSGNLFSLVEANALLIIPAGVKSQAVGDQVNAWLL